MALHIMLAVSYLSARKPADTLAAGRWEFVQNLGQWPQEVRFSARMHTGTIFFSDNYFTVSQWHPEQLNAFHEAKQEGKPFPQTYIDAAAYRVTFLQSQQNAKISGDRAYEHYYNYYIGKNPAKWASHANAYAMLHYHELYAGIDLFFLDDEDYLKYEFHVAPGSDPKQIQMKYEGLKSIAKVGEELLLHTAVDRILEL